MAMLHCSFCHFELQFLGNPQPMLIPVGYHQTIECPTTLFLTELLNLRKTIAPEHVEFEVWISAALSEAGQRIFAVKL